jgi:hypothetical protein
MVRVVQLAGGSESKEENVEWHRLGGKELIKAAGIGLLTSVILSTVMVAGLKAGISPMPAPVALAFAQAVFHSTVPLPVGLLFHVAWVTFWSTAYVALFRDELSLSRATGLAACLFALLLIVFYPFIGWGFFGLSIGPRVIAGGFITHALFAVILWALARLAFGESRNTSGAGYSRTL